MNLEEKFPTPPVNVFAAKALGTPAIANESERRPRYVYVYFMEDGSVVKLRDTEADTALMQQAYLVLVSIPGTPKTAPYVEIIKTKLGTGSIIMTCDPNAMVTGKDDRFTPQSYEATDPNNPHPGEYHFRYDCKACGPTFRGRHAR